MVDGDFLHRPSLPDGEWMKYFLFVIMFAIGCASWPYFSLKRCQELCAAAGYDKDSTGWMTIENGESCDKCICHHEDEFARDNKIVIDRAKLESK